MSAPTTRPPAMDPSAVELEDIDMPVILVSDFEENPPITWRYVNGDNELDFETVYRNISNLSQHPGRGLLSTDNEGDPEPVFHIKECDPEYLDAYWKCASNLCDYFADFLAFDSVAMQSVWFHLLDKLHEAAILPHQIWVPGVPTCKHSMDFICSSIMLQKIMELVVVPWRIPPTSSLIVCDYMVKYRMHVGKCGLRVWQEFLYKDSPGFLVPKSKRVYSIATRTTIDHTAFDAHIPRGGLALIDSHTKRLRALTEKTVQGESKTDTEASELAEFDSRALKLDRVSTYTAIDGRQILLQPMYPDPTSAHAPRQHLETIDPSFKLPKPRHYQVNESIGFYKGKDAYQHADDDDKKFSMLSFGSPETLQNRTPQSTVNRAAYSKMFDF